MFGSRWLVALVLCVAACAYPRRSTPLTRAANSTVAPHDAPSHLWRLVLVSADIPPQPRSGLAWDDDGGAPDAFAKLLIDGREVWTSEVIRDEKHPRFDAGPPKNLAVDRSKQLRLELWDDDGLGDEPIGMYEGRALADTAMGAEALLKLEGGATLTLRVERPEPHAGTGIALYEVRKDALVVLEVLPYSPAARAGLKPGDHITAVGDRLVDPREGRKAESALVLAAQNDSELTVNTGGKSRRVKLDKGYVWLSM